MNKLFLFSVKDNVTGLFSGLFMCQSAAEARRFFADWTKDPQNAIHANPEDYFLYQVGEFDRETGQGSFYDPIEFLCCGVISVAEAGSLAEAHRLIERLGSEVMNLRQEVDRLMHQKEAENK